MDNIFWLCCFVIGIGVYSKSQFFTSGPRLKVNGDNIISVEPDTMIYRLCEVVDFDNHWKLTVLRWMQHRNGSEMQLPTFTKKNSHHIIKLHTKITLEDDNSEIYCRAEFLINSSLQRFVTSPRVRVHVISVQDDPVINLAVEQKEDRIWILQVGIMDVAASFRIECFHVKTGSKNFTWDVYYGDYNDVNFQKFTKVIRDIDYGVVLCGCQIDYDNRTIYSNIVNKTIDKVKGSKIEENTVHPNENPTTSTSAQTIGPTESPEIINIEECHTSHAALISSAIALGVLCGAVLTAGLVYKKHCRKTTPKHSTLKSTEEDPVYSYVPIQMVSMYEARALLASNTSLATKTFVPSLPPRDEHVEDIYSYPR